jgi:hypothetical protein
LKNLTIWKTQFNKNIKVLHCNNKSCFMESSSYWLNSLSICKCGEPFRAYGSAQGLHTNLACSSSIFKDDKGREFRSTGCGEEDCMAFSRHAFCYVYLLNLGEVERAKICGRFLIARQQVWNAADKHEPVTLAMQAELDNSTTEWEKQEPSKWMTAPMIPWVTK